MRFSHWLTVFKNRNSKRYASTHSQARHARQSGRVPCRLAAIERLEDRTLLSGSMTDTGSISGVHFEDTNGNGAQDVDEPGQAGWTVYVDLNRNAQFDAGDLSAVTDADGQYQIDNVPVGHQIVRTVEQTGWKQTFPTVESQPQGTLIDVADRRDLVYDHTRHLLYITTAHGTVERYDMVSQTLLAPFEVGIDLYGADITEDGQYLYVAEGDITAGQGAIRKVDLDNGLTTNVAYALTALETGAWDIAIAFNGKALLTGDGISSIKVPLRELDLSTDVITIRADHALIEQQTMLEHSADRSRIVFFTNELRNYDSATDTFQRGFGTHSQAGSNRTALNSDGSSLAINHPGGTSIANAMTTDLTDLAGLLWGGLAFGPHNDALYAVDHITEEIVGFDTSGMQEVFRIDAQLNIDQAWKFDEGVATVSSDGLYLLLSTQDGVRQYVIDGSPQFITVTADTLATDISFGSVLRSVPNLLATESETLTTRPTLRWSTVPDASYYEVWVNDLTTGENGVIRQSGIIPAVFRPTTDLTPTHDYVWTVRAHYFDAVPGEWAIHSVFSISGISAPSTVSPVSTTSLMHPQFTWEPVANAVAYELSVNDRTTGEVGVIQVPHRIGTTFVPSSPLPINHEYVWMVRGIGPDGSLGEWSAQTVFSITPFDAPVVLTPRTVSSLSRPIFSWHAVPEGYLKGYRFVVEKVDNGASTLFIEIDTFVNSQDPVVSIESPTDFPPGDYRWRVRVLSEDAEWSDIIEFQVDFDGRKSIVVNSTDDQVDLTASGDEIVDTDFATPGSQISLRAAVQEANALQGNDTIELPAGHFRLSLPGQGENGAASGDLDVTDKTGTLTISGAGAGKTIIDAESIDRVFEVHSGARLELVGVTVTGGTKSGIFVWDSNLTVRDSAVSGNTSDSGGGISASGSQSSVQLFTSSLVGNSASINGGGIAIEGSLEIWNSTIADNHAVNLGGGIYIFGTHSGTSEFRVINSTISSNSADRGAGVALLRDPESTSVMQNVTVTGNTSQSFGAGILANGSARVQLAVQNSIVTGNIGPTELAGHFKSFGNNVLGNLTLAEFESPLRSTDQTEVDVLSVLDPVLRDNGGLTPTHALIAGSPAIDAGDNIGNTDFDQRGFARVADGNLDGVPTIDIGAVEWRPRPRAVSPVVPTFLATPQFTWKPVSGAVAYDLWVNDRTTGEVGVIREPSLIGNSFTSATRLPINHDYVWTVRAQFSNGDWTPWDAYREFSVIDPSPAALQTLPLVTIDTTPTFGWSAIPGATGYDVEIQATADPANVVVAANTAVPTFTSPQLQPGEYSWTVRGVAGDDSRGEWSDPQTFVIDVNQSPQPTSPIGATHDITPTFDWETVTGATQYELRVSDSQTGDILFAETTTSTEFTPFRPLFAGPYEWSVRAVNDAELATPWSTSQTFAFTPDPARLFEVNDMRDVLDTTPVGDGQVDTDPSAEGNQVSLRAAILDANAQSGSHVIQLSAGRYELSLPNVSPHEDDMMGDLDIRDELVIIGAGAGLTVIDADELDRVFEIHPGATLHLIGVTVTGGKSGSGGGGLYNNGALTLTDVSVESNFTSSAGGGLYNSRTAIADVRDSQFRDNLAKKNHSGGGVIITYSSEPFRDSQYTGAGTGGGIWNAGTLTAVDIDVVDNEARDGYWNGFGFGGGGGILNTGTLELRDSRIIGNLSTESGGGIFNVNDATLTIVNTTVASNQSYDFGGGLYNRTSHTHSPTDLPPVAVSIVNSVFADNTARQGGAGIYTDETVRQVVLDHVTITGNSGTGIVNALGEVLVGNSIIADNTASDIPGALSSPDFAGEITSLGYNLIGDMTGTALLGDDTGNLVGHAPRLHAVYDADHRLSYYIPLPNSPVIDAARPESSLVTDQRGWTRSFDGNLDGEAVPDIGAVEMQETVGLLSPTEATLDPTPTFVWTEATGADRYRLRIDNLTTGEQSLLDVTVTETNFTPTADLPADDELAWTITPISDAGFMGVESEPMPFRVDLDLRSTSLTTLAETLDTRPDFVWDAVAGAVGYEFELHNVDDLLPVLQFQTSTTDTALTLPMSLPSGPEFGARVRAVSDDGNAGAWTSMTRFHVNTSLAPTLQGPLGITDDLTPSFTWSEVPGAAWYDLWVNNLSTGEGEIIRQTHLTHTEFEPTSPLPDGDRFIWTVRAVSDDGVPGAWADHQVFEIPHIVTLRGPLEAIAQDRAPGFYWNTTRSYTTAELWVNDVTTGEFAILRRDVTGTRRSYDTSNLESREFVVGHDYLWSVRVTFHDGTKSSWADYAIFSSVFSHVPETPIGVTIDVTPTFEWVRNPAAQSIYARPQDGFLFGVNDLTTGEDWILRESGIRDHEYTNTQEPLSPGHSYIWSVGGLGRDSARTEAWADHRIFTVDPSAAPRLIGPAVRTLDATPTFQWSELHGAVHYDLWVNNLTTGEIGFIRERNLTQTSFNPSVDLPDGDYVWTVRGVTDDGAFGGWAEHRIVSVRSMGRPMPIGPRTATYDNTPAFAWTVLPGAETYDLWVNDLTTGQSGVIRKTDSTSSVYTSATPLIPGHEYLWTVRGITDEGIAGPWAPHQYFAVAPLSAPDLLAPGNLPATTAPTFRWTSVTAADHYDLWVNDLTTGQIGVIRERELTNAQFTARYLVPGHDYVWTVRSVDIHGGESGWARHRYFTVDAELETVATNSQFGSHVVGDEIAVASDELNAPADSSVQLALSADQHPEATTDAVLADWPAIDWWAETVLRN